MYEPSEPLLHVRRHGTFCSPVRGAAVVVVASLCAVAAVVALGRRGSSNWAAAHPAEAAEATRTAFAAHPAEAATAAPPGYWHGVSLGGWLLMEINPRHANLADKDVRP